MFVGGDEALRDHEGDGRVHLGEGNGFRVEFGREGDAEGVAFDGEDGRGLVHAAGVDAHGAFGDDG